MATFSQLGGNIVGAFEPILTAVIPMITELLGYLNTAIEVVAKFFATITGKNTITKAVKQQKDYAKSVSGSAKANEKLLASFDELNKLNESNSSGSDTISYTEETFSPWQELKDLIDSGNWQGLGELIAERINQAISEIDFEGIGTKLGETIQKGVEFAFGFLSNIDTFQIGNGIMTALASAIDAIDFNMMAQDLMLLAIRFFDFLAGVFDTSNGNDEKIGQAIADFVNGGSSKLLELGESSGEAVGNFAKFLTGVLDEAIKNIDWGQLFLNLIASLVIFVGEVSESVNDILDEYLWGIPQEANEFQRKYQEVLRSGSDEEKAIYEAKIKYAEEHGMKAWEVTDQQLQDQRALYQENKNKTVEIMQQENEEKLAAMDEYDAAIKERLENEEGDLILQDMQDKIDNEVYKDTAQEAMSQVADGVSSPEEIKKIKDVFTNLITFLDTTFSKQWETSWDNIALIFNNVWNGIIASAEKAINSIVDALNAINFTIPDWVEGYGGKSFALNLSHVSIPRLATGTVIPPNASEFLAVLGDNNQDTEVVSPLETIKEALSEVMATNTNQNITINFKGNLSQLARILKPEIETEDNRVGRSLVVKGA